MNKETPVTTLKPQTVCNDCDRPFALCTPLQATRWALRGDRCPSCDSKRQK
jgi:DNA-directed RNA polymerase subunit RPC12/RpoP